MDTSLPSLEIMTLRHRLLWMYQPIKETRPQRLNTKHKRFLFSNITHSTDLLTAFTPRSFLRCLRHAHEFRQDIEPPHVFDFTSRRTSNQSVFQLPSARRCLIGLLHQLAISKFNCDEAWYSLWIFGHHLQVLQSRRGGVRRSCA